MSSRWESELARLEKLLLEADERAELERRRADEAGERAEQERQHADDERRSRKEADERAELERRRAEDEQRNRQEAESRAQIEERKTRPTTFEEYIRACHTLLSKPLRIQTDKSLGTQGSITSPNNKPCPTLLKPWTDFPILQQQLFEKLGKDLCDRPLASEKDLEAYQRLAVERPTTHIISHLCQIEEARREFNLGGGIIFENHANTLSNDNEEVQQSLYTLRISSKGQASSSNPKP